MNFIKKSVKQIENAVSICSYRELILFIKYIDDVSNGTINIKKLNTQTKKSLYAYVVDTLLNPEISLKICEKLTSTEALKFIYNTLTWEMEHLRVSEIPPQFSIKLESEKKDNYPFTKTKQKGNLLFINREQIESITENEDLLTVESNFKSILRVILPMPFDAELLAVASSDLIKTDFTYSNEDNIFDFISVINDMLKNTLVEFGKTNEKPLAKTLKILKNSTDIREFYSDKKLDSFATDMLTRSFSYYYWHKKDKTSTGLNLLKEFVNSQLEDEINFFITKIFLTHLKRVRFDSYYTKQRELFDAIKLIISSTPTHDWIDVINIIKFCRCRDVRIDLESRDKTRYYYMEYHDSNYKDIFDNGILIEEKHYDMLFLEPIIKASFYFLGALGLFELKYDDPLSAYSISAKGKPYISVWDSLKYVKMTELGRYIFGYEKSYKQKKIIKKENKIKFDEYKPIITIDPKDTIMQAKLDPYMELYDTNRYILSYTKIFKDCKNTKALELKIDRFYKQISVNPPEVFNEFFDEIKRNQNLLKRDLKQITIELKSNKKLLHLFMKNKKLQELVTKVPGYRVLVSKQDIPKLTKIVKDNGFFVEF